MLQIATILAVTAIVPVMAVDTCRSATSDEFNALPGVSKFFDLVKADFGGSSSTGHAVNAGVDTPTENTVRPTGDSTDRRGNICMGGGPFNTAPTGPGDVVCSSQTTDFGGQFDGGSGTITSQLQSGLAVAGQWSTTTSSMVGTDLSTSISVKIPEIADVGVTASTTFQVTNTESASTTSTVNQVQTFSATANVPLGSTCKMLINVTTCTVNTRVEVPITFNGFVNTHFDHEATYTGQPEDNKHFDWWISPSVYPMDPTDMGSVMTVSGSLQSTSYGDAYISCTGANGTSDSPLTAQSAKLGDPVPAGNSTGASAATVAPIPSGKTSSAASASTSGVKGHLAPSKASQSASSPSAKSAGHSSASASAKASGATDKPASSKGTNASPTSAKSAGASGPSKAPNSAPPSSAKSAGAIGISGTSNAAKGGSSPSAKSAVSSGKPSASMAASGSSSVSAKSANTGGASAASRSANIPSSASAKSAGATGKSASSKATGSILPTSARSSGGAPGASGTSKASSSASSASTK